MGQLLSLFIVLVISMTASAQIEFGSLIDESIQNQNSLAEEIKASDQLAKNVESDEFDEELEEVPVQNYNTIVTDPEAAKKSQAENAGQSANSARNPASESEFGLKLKPATGTESALKYFPNLRNKRSKKDRNLAKSEALDTGLNQEPKAEVKKSSKKKSHKKVKASSGSKSKVTVAKNSLKKADKKKSRKVAATQKKKKSPKSRGTASSTQN